MRFTAGSICAGPSEQFMPTAHTPSPSAMATIASGEAPVMVLQPPSNTQVAMTGRSPPHSFAATSAALSS